MGASARVFFVANTLDSTNTDSLRGAIIAASELSGNSTIVLPQAIFRLSLYQVGAQTGYSGGLTITKGDLVIRGSPEAMISASGLSGWGFPDCSVMHILPGARVRLENLVLTGGAGKGGGIHNEGTLELVNCVVTGNAGSYEGGGGIYNSGLASVDRCSVSANSAGNGFGGAGGGIYNTGSLLINRCAIWNNSTMNGVDGDFLGGDGVRDMTVVGPIPGWPGRSAGNGGAICNLGTLKLADSVIFGNVCGSGGNGTEGADAPAGDGGDGGSGGGIYNAGSLKMVHCSVESNSCGAGGNGANAWYTQGLPQGGNGGNGGNGGGIFNAGHASRAVLIETTVISNSAGGGGQPGNAGAPGLAGPDADLAGTFRIHSL
jgi:hypothetical protein